MSEVRGKVGKTDFGFTSVPRGPAGIGHVQIDGAAPADFRWKKDADGISIELAGKWLSFDLEGESGEDARIAYRVTRRGHEGEWIGQTFSRIGDEASAAVATSVKKGFRIRAQMPGKVIRVLVKSGAKVEKDQPLVVIEAMKMENEIRAPQGGVLSQVRVSEGQAVETGAELLVIESL